MNARIVLLPGDGIGPEVVGEAVRALDEIAVLFGHEFTYDSQLIGGAAIDATGSALPDETLAACRAADAVLLGAVGGPKWDDPKAKVRPEQGLLAIRKELGLFANLRPVSVHPALADASPLRPERIAGADLLIVRELTGGLYFGVRYREGEKAVDTLEYTQTEIDRVLRLAFSLAQGRRKLVTSVDKANVLDTSRLWRERAVAIAADYPDVKLEHQLVDSCAMRLVTHPTSFDVVVTENMFGDILSDEASVLAGSLGLLPSASFGAGTRGLYEPIHGSAPDIAGKGVANPVGTMRSAAMLLRHSLGLEKEAKHLEECIDAALAKGARTRDLGGALSTREMADLAIERINPI